MKKVVLLSLLILLELSCSNNRSGDLAIDGLEEPVEIIRDQWGINHIYANNQHDLFFAQGYAAAKDRLFQFEIWRRQATGTVAELLGERELKRDIGTRLFKFRGSMDEEMRYYHDDGIEIIEAYVAGVNAYIDEAIRTNSLPIEFDLLGTKPQKWTPEVVISRHQGLLGNITEELDYGRAVAKVGPEKVKQLSWFHPKDPIMALDPVINGELLDADILELYNAYRRPVRFRPEDLANPSLAKENPTALRVYQPKQQGQPSDDRLNLGSNNWVVSGNKTASGHTVMANDPHRTIAIPSLRYMAHLVAPGWNVIGGGEPEIPGISIGHNEYGAWGLTVFGTDGEDLYVYDLNPNNINQYRYKDGWREMETMLENIPVKDHDPVTVKLQYTHHGPVTYIDSINLKAYAVRCAWLEPGGAPYLASLRMDQAKDWSEFRDACAYSNIPGENMIWAGTDGTIGWQAVGIAPVRKNFSGLVPVPGDGRYEWDGYLPILEKPNLVNPANGFIGTANQNVTPPTYTRWDAIGYDWADPYRGDRVNEVLEQENPLDIEAMKALQTDYYSIPASLLIPYLASIEFDNELINEAKEKLLNWDFELNKSSIPAAIYVAWENEIKNYSRNLFIPENVNNLLYIQLKTTINWIEYPELMFGTKEERNKFLETSFKTAIADLSSRLGSDINKWQYGQELNKHVQISHALGRILDDSLSQLLNVGPLPRGGNSYTPGSTGSNYNQTSGASFRLIVDTGNWDKAIGTNSPGQSGNPESEFYNNLFRSWANDEYFPVYYSKEKIKEVAVETVTLSPQGN